LPGTVSSSEGNLIVDVGARVDAHINVAVAMMVASLTVILSARERVEAPGCPDPRQYLDESNYHQGWRDF